MVREKPPGTRFTTGCGHSWKRTPPRYDIATLAGCTSDCAVCGALLIIPVEQFKGMDLSVYPANVHMPLFHKWMHRRDPRWPEDGTNTGWVEF